MQISPKKEAIGHTFHHNFFMNCNIKFDIHALKKNFKTHEQQQIIHKTLKY